MPSRVTEAGWVGLLAGLMAVVFVVWPHLDLATSALFFHAGEWTAWRNSLPAQLLYRGMPPVGQGILAVLAAIWMLGFLRPFQRLQVWRRTCAFLLLAALIGQGLLVDQGLKNHLGRARPSQIVEFGGDKRFTPAFIPSDQCERNCSFASGHVAAAAFVMGFGWLGDPRRRRRWLLVSVLSATAMGFVRIMQGGHFLSDAMFAWFATYFSFWLTARLLRTPDGSPSAHRAD